MSDERDGTRQRRTLIRRSLQQRRQAAHEQLQQQQKQNEHVRLLAQAAFQADEREVHRMLASEAQWFFAAVSSALLVAALVSWELF